ncbi:transcriptional regulator [Aeromonas caviae]
MNSSTELELRANGNSVMVVDHAGDLLFDVTLSIAEVRIVSALFAQNGNVIEKEQLISIGWSGKPVSSSALTVAISNIRSALKKAGIEIKNIPRLGYVMNLASAHPAQVDTTQVINNEDNNELSIVLVHDDELHDERQVTTVDIKTGALSYFMRWQVKSSIRSIMRVFLLSTAVAFFISMLAAYLYEASPTVCVPEQDRIVCTSDDPDFHFSNMSIEFDIESFIHHAFEES